MRLLDLDDSDEAQESSDEVSSAHLRILRLIHSEVDRISLQICLCLWKKLRSNSQV